jgi:hypothetical protein
MGTKSRNLPAQQKGPPAHPPEPGYPCYVSVLGELAWVAPREEPRQWYRMPRNTAPLASGYDFTRPHRETGWPARRIRLVAYGARLESVLGASPRGFESPILRHMLARPAHRQHPPQPRFPSRVTRCAMRITPATLRYRRRAGRHMTLRRCSAGVMHTVVA